MSFFGKFYLDKDKDIVVSLDMEKDVLSYILSIKNHRRDNLINNLAVISHTKTTIKDNKRVIEGIIPCYIKGDGKKVYVFRLNGIKIANIYEDGKIEVNSTIPAIAKTLMSQTKNYKYSFKETLVKSYVPYDVKLKTDLHTHGNASLDGDLLIALGIKHQIRYPLYYIKKLKLILTNEQTTYLNKKREEVKKQLDLSLLEGKYKERKIDDNTFINFADLILYNKKNASYNINKIRQSLMILKDSQAVFTNLEKLYLYRYVFTKGVEAEDKVILQYIEDIEDNDIRQYLYQMLEDQKKEQYKDITLYEDTLLWIGREYRKKHIYYVEISDTTLVKKDESNALMLKRIHHILPYVKEETGVDIRFLAAIRRIPLTIVKQDITSDNYLTEAIQALKVVCHDPYVVGSDFVGEEINDIAELKDVIKEIVSEIAKYDENWTIRVHAGENDSLKNNMAKAIELIEESLDVNQKFPYMRIGHGVYCANLKSEKGKKLLAKIKEHDIVLEFQLTSNVRLNNIIELKTHPIKLYLNNDISCVMGTDGCGLYGTNSIDEQLALMNFLKISDDDFKKMKQVEDTIILRQQNHFQYKMNQLNQKRKQQIIYDYYKDQLQKENQIKTVKFAINKYPTYPCFKEQIQELPWDKYPIIIAGGSFGNPHIKIDEYDKNILTSLLDYLDPQKVFFVIGHNLVGQEKYIVDHNKGFDIYSIIPSLMDEKQIKRLKKSSIKGIRISTESQEMGIYKSFNYEIFERRNSVLLAFDGNSSIANLVQEARNGKAKTYIYIYPQSHMLKAKAKSLSGYVTIQPSIHEIIEKIEEVQDNIGTKK